MNVCAENVPGGIVAFGSLAGIAGLGFAAGIEGEAGGGTGGIMTGPVVKIVSETGRPPVPTAALSALIASLKACESSRPV